MTNMTNNSTTLGKRPREDGANDSTDSNNLAKRAREDGDNRLNISFLKDTIRRATNFEQIPRQMPNPHTPKLDLRMKKIDTTIADPQVIAELKGHIERLQKLAASRAVGRAVCSADITAATPAAALPTQQQPAITPSPVNDVAVATAEDQASAPKSGGRARPAWIREGLLAGIHQNVIENVLTALHDGKTKKVKSLHTPTADLLTKLVQNWTNEEEDEQVTLLVAAYYASKLTNRKVVKKDDVQEQDAKEDTVQPIKQEPQDASPAPFQTSGNI